MAYLYGDSTSAPFDDNFLEALRDAMDLAAAIAESDERIVTADARKLACTHAADAEALRLEELARAMLEAAATAEKGGAGSETHALSAELTGIVSERHRGATLAVTAKLTEDVRAIDAAALHAQVRYRTALEAYMLVREPPDAQSQLTLTLTSRGKNDDRYDATTTGWSELGLTWEIEHAVPEGGPWSKPVRVDRVLDDGLTILAPQKSGLIKKEVKVKKQKLDRHLVTRLVDDGATVSMELRTDVSGDMGFDLAVQVEKQIVTGARVGPEADIAIGPFDVDPDDLAALVLLAQKLRETSQTLPRKKLRAASFDGAPFDGGMPEHQPTLVILVSKLVAKLAPVVREIAARSRAEDELVLRRSLRDGHREEIFLPKEMLRGKISTLDAAHRALFAPLCLEATPTAGPFSANEPPTMPTVRSKVPSTINVPGEAPPPPASDPAKASEPQASYEDYAALFSSAGFATRTVDDRRDALKKLIFAVPLAAPSDEMRAAHQAAVAALQLLVVERRDPADYEMLGLAYSAIGQPGQAIEIWRKALDLERARDPVSELHTRLSRRVSEQPP